MKEMAEIIYETIKDSDGVGCFIKRGNLVRCKDCQHQDDLQYEVGGKFVCRKGHGWNTNDFFCADGEPRKWKEGDGE